MTKRELMALGLDDATAEQVLAAHVEQMRGFVPRSRLNEEIAARRAAEELAAGREAEIAAMRGADRSEEMRLRIQELEEAQARLAGEHEEALHRAKVDRAVDVALIGARARNVKAARALLVGLEQAELQEDGTVKGLGEQIEALKRAEDSRFLFDSALGRRMRGAYVGEDGIDDGDGSPDLTRMSYSQLAAYLAEHPEAETHSR